jgi:hypothetical protein
VLLFFGPTASLVSFLAVFNFSIQDSTGSLCLFPVSPVGQLVLRVTMPFVCITLLFIVAAAHGLLCKFSPCFGPCPLFTDSCFWMQGCIAAAAGRCAVWPV